MTPTRTTFAGSYAKFAGVGGAAAGVLAAVGYFPTARFVSEGALASVLTGCGISWVASCCGAVPLASAAAGPGREAAQAILISTGVRFLVTLLLVAPAALSGWFPRTALVVWVGISYLVLLLIDTALAVRLMKRFDENKTR